MKFIIAKDYDEMSSIGAGMVIDQVKVKPDSVLGFATGSTPLGLYRCLIEENNKGLDFSKTSTFNLDEYYGLSPDHSQSYHYFMYTNLFDHINVDKANVHIPGGLCEDVEEACRKYDTAIKDAGGIDLQILGIGRNGHIGFNEPDKCLKVLTHLTDLTEDTIQANSRFFDSLDDVPKKAITMGMGTIMRAKKIVLLASGKDKAPILAKLAQPVVDTDVPASMLHLHNNTVIIADKDAASLMDLDEAIDLL